MSIGTQKHTPELIEKWLGGDGWNYPQGDGWAARNQGWSVKMNFESGDTSTAISDVVKLVEVGIYTEKGTQHYFNSDKEALDWVVSRAISGNALAIKALCYLSHHNPSEYGHWGKLLKGMYGGKE